MSYDVKCYELAKTFLQDKKLDTDVLISKLAQEIQTTIEDFIKWEKPK